MIINKNSTRNSNKLYITPDGTLKSLHSPLIDKIKGDLGSTTITRASSIEPNNETGLWECIINQTGEKFTAPDKESLLILEKEKINDLLKKGEYK